MKTLNLEQMVNLQGRNDEDDGGGGGSWGAICQFTCGVFGVAVGAAVGSVTFGFFGAVAGILSSNGCSNYYCSNY